MPNEFDYRSALIAVLKAHGQATIPPGFDASRYLIEVIFNEAGEIMILRAVEGKK